MTILPRYTPPDFTRPPLVAAPAARVVAAPADGVLPERFHATSNVPEYLHLGGGRWLLAEEGRMDGVMLLRGKSLEIVAPRRVRQGDPVVIGRSEHGEEGIYVHASGFAPPAAAGEAFAFRTRGSRETPFSHSYDTLGQLLRHEREHGYIVWVAGPAAVFDRDSRAALRALIEAGYCHALLAGNALATHDLEAARFRTGLGQDIYTQAYQPLGHYNHLDIINEVRSRGGIARTVEELRFKDGIMYACQCKQIPFVLAGSIRDDGPLPEVIADAYQAQDAMRVHARKATTVIAVATQLHSIAFGNMVPSYHVESDGSVRPVFFYVVDMTEFCVDKLANRGSAQAEGFLTNAQDFMVNLWNNLKESITRS